MRYRGWIPAGIFHDLIDNTADVVRTEYTEDKIRKDYIDYAGTFTNQEFFKCMEKDVRSPQQFRDRLMVKTSNRDQSDVNSLFEAYYFN